MRWAGGARTTVLNGVKVAVVSEEAWRDVLECSDVSFVSIEV